MIAVLMELHPSDRYPFAIMKRSGHVPSVELVGKAHIFRIRLYYYGHRSYFHIFFFIFLSSRERTWYLRSFCDLLAQLCSQSGRLFSPLIMTIRFGLGMVGFVVEIPCDICFPRQSLVCADTICLHVGTQVLCTVQCCLLLPSCCVFFCILWLCALLFHSFLRTDAICCFYRFLSSFTFTSFLLLPKDQLIMDANVIFLNFFLFHWWNGSLTQAAASFRKPLIVEPTTKKMLPQSLQI